MSCLNFPVLSSKHPEPRFETSGRAFVNFSMAALAGCGLNLKPGTDHQIEASGLRMLMGFNGFHDSKE